MKIWVFPGSFDPVTNGHMDIIRRCTRLCDRLIVAVLYNPAKSGIFSVEERMTMLRESCADLPGVSVDSFYGLLVDYLKRQNVSTVVRGIRTPADSEYESAMAVLNRDMLPGMETVFLPTVPELAAVSSSAVREIATFGGTVENFVPEPVAFQIRKKYAAVYEKQSVSDKGE